MFRKRFDKEEEEFQSAPPVKGAIRQGVLRAELRDVSIRAPREGGDFLTSMSFLKMSVSIRAPREGGDSLHPLHCLRPLVSIRAPREGGDECSERVQPPPHVSIRAPREGGDGTPATG